jgi:hypothetical protein
MRRARLVAIATALALVPLTAALPATAASTSPSSSVDITFDGYCDGLTVTMPSAGLGKKGTVDGTQIGCESGQPFFGQAVPKRRKYGVTRGTEFITLDAYGFFVSLRKDNTFSFYSYGGSGNEIFEALTGTWSLGTPSPTSGSPSATQSALAVVAAGPTAATNAAASPNGVLELTFEGFCDGMRLNSPSVGTGVAGTVDGELLGCAEGGIIGAQGKVANKKNTYAVQWDNAGTWVQTAIFKDHTWVHYIITDGVMSVLNSGTWVDGPPPPGAAGPHSSIG